MAAGDTISQLFAIAQENSTEKLSEIDFEKDLRSSIFARMKDSKTFDSDFKRVTELMLFQAEKNPDLLIVNSGEVKFAESLVSKAVNTIKYENQFVPGTIEFEQIEQLNDDINGATNVLLTAAVAQNMIDNYDKLTNEDKQFLSDHARELSEDQMEQVIDKAKAATKARIINSNKFSPEKKDKIIEIINKNEENAKESDNRKKAAIDDLLTNNEPNDETKELMKEAYIKKLLQMGITLEEFNKMPVEQQYEIFSNIEREALAEKKKKSDIIEETEQHEKSEEFALEEGVSEPEMQNDDNDRARAAAAVLESDRLDDRAEEVQNAILEDKIWELVESVEDIELVEELSSCLLGEMECSQRALDFFTSKGIQQKVLSDYIVRNSIINSQKKEYASKEANDFGDILSTYQNSHEVDNDKTKSSIELFEPRIIPVEDKEVQPYVEKESVEMHVAPITTQEKESKKEVKQPFKQVTDKEAQPYVESKSVDMAVADIPKEVVKEGLQDVVGATSNGAESKIVVDLEDTSDLLVGNAHTKQQSEQQEFSDMDKEAMQKADAPDKEDEAEGKGTKTEKENAETIQPVQSVQTEETKQDTPKVEKESVFGKMKKFFDTMKYLKENNPEKGFFSRLTDSFKVAYSNIKTVGDGSNDVKEVKPAPAVTEVVQESQSFVQQVKIDHSIVNQQSKQVKDQAKAGQEVEADDSRENE